MAIIIFSSSVSDAEVGKDADGYKTIDVKKKFERTMLKSDSEVGDESGGVQGGSGGVPLGGEGSLDEDHDKYSDQPICSKIRNLASYTVLGTITTDYDIFPDGMKARHSSNFRIKPEGFAEFCSKGPFYEGQRVDFVLKSLFPIFSCRTKVGREIVIIGSKRIDGSYDTRAICH